MALCFRCGRIEAAGDRCPRCGRELPGVLLGTVSPAMSPKAPTQQQLGEARAAQEREGGTLGTHLVRLGYLSADKLTDFLSANYGVPRLALADFVIDADVARLLPRETVERLGIIPVNKAGRSLTIAMSDPSNIFAIDEVSKATSLSVEVVLAGAQEIRAAIDRWYAEP